MLTLQSDTTINRNRNILSTTSSSSTGTMQSSILSHFQSSSAPQHNRVIPKESVPRQKLDLRMVPKLTASTEKKTTDSQSNRSMLEKLLLQREKQSKLKFKDDNEEDDYDRRRRRDDDDESGWLSSKRSRLEDDMGVEVDGPGISSFNLDCDGDAVSIPMQTKSERPKMARMMDIIKTRPQSPVTEDTADIAAPTAVRRTTAIMAPEIEAAFRNASQRVYSKVLEIAQICKSRFENCSTCQKTATSSSTQSEIEHLRFVDENEYASHFSKLLSCEIEEELIAGLESRRMDSKISAFGAAAEFLNQLVQYSDTVAQGTIRMFQQQRRESRRSGLLGDDDFDNGLLQRDDIVLVLSKQAMRGTLMLSTHD